MRNVYEDSTCLSVLGLGERKHIFLSLIPRSALLNIITMNSTVTVNSSDVKSNLKYFAELKKGFKESRKLSRLLCEQFYFSLFSYRLLSFTVFTRLA